MSRGKESSFIAVTNLEGGETLFFLNPRDFAFVPIRGVDYSPQFKTLIRVMDTPEEDIYHTYIEQKIPPIIHKRIYGIS